MTCCKRKVKKVNINETDLISKSSVQRVFPSNYLQIVGISQKKRRPLVEDFGDDNVPSSVVKDTEKKQNELDLS